MNKCWCGNEAVEDYSKDYFCCKKCGTLISKNDFTQQIVNVQDEENDLYGAQYWEKGMIEKAKVNSLEELHRQYLTGRVPYWFKHLLEFLPLGGNIAEVGCGLGDLSFILDRAGFIVEAYELSNDNCNYIKQKFNISIVCDEFSNRHKNLDGIISIDVFEHMLDPIGFLKKSRECISENGVLCLQTPCYNPELTYNEIEKRNMDFKKLLAPEEHIYLFSRKAMEKSLRSAGFNYFQYVPAFFGDDYDMFVFASSQPLKKNTQEEIDKYLNKTENGELLKSWLCLFETKRQYERWKKEANNNSEKQLKDIDKLTNQINLLNKTCVERLNSIESLSKQVNEKDIRLEELDKACVMRLHNIEELTAQLQERDGQVELLNKACEERLRGIEELTVQLQERDGQVEMLNKACEERLLGIAELTKQLHEKDKQIEELNAACEERLKNINVLTETIQALQTAQN